MKNFQKKSFRLLCLIFVVFYSFFLSCSQKDVSVYGNKSLTKNKLSATSARSDIFLEQMENSTFVENEFAKTLSIETNSVKLIGFKTIYLKDDEVIAFKALIKSHPEKFAERKNYFFSQSGKFFRVYFPLHTAIINYKGREYVANEKGIVSINEAVDPNQISVIGRKKSSFAQGTGSNIVKGNQILLKGALMLDTWYADEQIYIIDLGIRSFGKNNGHSCCNTIKSNEPIIKDEKPLMPSITTTTELPGDKVSCYENHGSRNCSTAFGIHKGRCSYNNLECMDYNGWFTDCINGKTLNFPGSDCDYAMGMGHCWNELM